MELSFRVTLETFFRFICNHVAWVISACLYIAGTVTFLLLSFCLIVMCYNTDNRSSFACSS